MIKSIDTNENGFSLLETLVTMAIMVFVFVLTILAYGAYEDDSDLQGQVDLITGKIDLARERTISAYLNDTWGFRVSTSTSPQELVIFKGSSFATRDSAYDAVTELGGSVEVVDVDFEGEDWVVFDRLSGKASTTGYLYLELVEDRVKNKTIYLNQEGLSSTKEFSSGAFNGRYLDYRHVHIKYDRVINTASEEIILNFDGGTVIQNVPIDENLIDGQMYWQDEIDVSGKIQTIEIRTHRINNPDTIFSIRRESDLNDVSLDIDISGDSWLSPQLISYSADGVTVATGTSPSVDYISRQ